MSHSPLEIIDLVMRHILVYFYISKSFRLKKSYLPDHPQIYVYPADLIFHKINTKAVGKHPKLFLGGKMK